MSKIKMAVSLYSLQDEYLNHRMNLSDIVSYVKENGAEGIEILPDQMLKGAPHISDKTVEEFKGLMKEHDLKPVCADVFLNTNLYKNRSLTQKESVDLLIEEIKQANRLGIHLIRLVSMVPYWVIEPLIPYCEEYDVTIALEVHAGMAFDIPQTREFIKEMKRVNSPYVGLVIDTGIFCRRLPRVVRAYEGSIGTSESVFDYIDALFDRGSDLHQDLKQNNGFSDEFKAAMKSEHDKMSAPLLDGYENYEYSVLDEYLPYIKHFHFKMWEMTEEGPEYSIDFKGLLQYLHEKNYDGYVACEYEGNRFTLAGKPMQERQQVAMFLKYIGACLKEIQG